MTTTPLQDSTFSACEISLLKLFSDDYQLELPRYQRPYAWDKDNARELYEDLTAAMKNDAEENYFLGSIVLTKKAGDRNSEKNKFAIVDGQQRLTTLTILFCVLRELAEQEDDKQNLDQFVRESANRYAGTKNQFRLELRHQDNPTFQQKILLPGQLHGFLEQNPNTLNESLSLIQQNAQYLMKELSQASSGTRDDLTTFLIQKRYMVVVTAASQESAHRIFSVMNTRGKDLSPTDILKADVLDRIHEAHQEFFMTRWEEIEESLTRDHFTELFRHIYTIKKRQKPGRSLNEGFLTDILKQKASEPNYQQGDDFIEDTLEPYATAYKSILEKNFQGPSKQTDQDRQINQCLHSLQKVTSRNYYWVAPALEFIRRFEQNGPALSQLLKDLERITYGMLFLPLLRDSRRPRYDQILAALENTPDDQPEQLLQEDSPLQLTPTEQRDILNKLEEPLTFLGTELKREILLKLDGLLTEAGATYQRNTITVEHVLPQKPGPDSEWLRNFTPEEREAWTDRLANLVLLSRSKNASAQNYDFEEKKTKYFDTKQQPPFALTTQVIREQEWTPQVLEKRQRELISLLASEWRLAK